MRDMYQIKYWKEENVAIARTMASHEDSARANFRVAHPTETIISIERLLSPVWDTSTEGEEHQTMTRIPDSNPTLEELQARGLIGPTTKEEL